MMRHLPDSSLAGSSPDAALLAHLPLGTSEYSAPWQAQSHSPSPYKFAPPSPSPSAGCTHLDSDYPPPISPHRHSQYNPVHTISPVVPAYPHSAHPPTGYSQNRTQSYNAALEQSDRSAPLLMRMGYTH